jgi:hypothetical protein
VIRSIRIFLWVIGVLAMLMISVVALAWVSTDYYLRTHENGRLYMLLNSFFAPEGYTDPILELHLSGNTPPPMSRNTSQFSIDHRYQGRYLVFWHPDDANAVWSPTAIQCSKGEIKLEQDRPSSEGRLKFRLVGIYSVPSDFPQGLSACQFSYRDALGGTLIVKKALEN